MSETDISQQMNVSEDKGYGAFSLNTSHTVVQEWQNNLNTMKSDGTFEAIWSNGIRARIYRDVGIFLQVEVLLSH